MMNKLRSFFFQILEKIYGNGKGKNRTHEKKSVLLLISLTILLSFCANYVQIVNASGSVWYDTSWSYVRPITITNSSVLLNYQVLVNITNTTNMNSTGQDIRFTYNDNTTLLPYWIENWSTNNAQVWVITNQSNPNMWYGNPTATSQSNKGNVFNILLNSIQGASYYKSSVPDPSYVDTGNLEFTDGNLSAVYGDTASFGYQNNNANVTVDFGSNKRITTINSHHISQTGVTLRIPNPLTIFSSTDNTTWTNLGNAINMSGDTSTASAVWFNLSVNPVIARYIRYVAIRGDVWLFFDEGQVMYTNISSPEPTVSIGAEQSQVTISNWCNSSYPYRVPLNINTTIDLINYQIPFNLTYDTGMNANFSDLLYCDKNGVQRPFWIESNVSSLWASGWINATVTTANGVQGYIYFGNPSAVSASNITQTMIFGDDVTSDKSSSYGKNGSLWTYNANNYYKINGSTVCTDSVCFMPIYDAGNMTQNYTIYAEMSGDITANTNFGFIHNAQNNLSTTSTYFDRASLGIDNKLQVYKWNPITLIKENTSLFYQSNNKYFLNLTVTTTGSFDFWLWNATTIRNVTGSDATWTTGWAGFSFYGNNNNAVAMYLYRLYIKQKANIEPTVSIGAKETYSGDIDTNTYVSVTLNQPSNGGLQHTQTIPMNFTVTSNVSITGCDVWSNKTGSWAFLATNSSSILNNTLTTINNIFSLIGSYLWNVNCTDTESKTNTSTTNFTFTITDTIAPSVYLTSPVNGSTTSNTVPDFIFNYTDSFSSTSSATLYINASSENENGTYTLLAEAPMKGMIGTNSPYVNGKCYSFALYYQGDGQKSLTYDTVTNTWAYIADFPVLAEAPTPIYLPNVYADGIILMQTLGTRRDTYLYNITTNTYTAKTASPCAHYEAGIMANFGNDIIYYWGGGGGGGGDCGKYNVTADTWTCTCADYTFGSGVEVVNEIVINDTLYVNGGLNTTQGMYNTYKYNSTTDTWTALANMLMYASPDAGINGAWYGKFNNMLHVFGGMYYTPSVPTNVTHKHQIYNPSTNTWSWSNDIPSNFLPTNTGGACQDGLLTPNPVGTDSTLWMLLGTSTYTPITESNQTLSFSINDFNWIVRGSNSSVLNSTSTAISNATALPVGDYQWYLTITDSSGNVAQSETRTFTITEEGDSTPPTITIISPLAQIYNTISIWFRVIISEIASWVGYSLDNAANITMTNSSGEWNAQNTSMTEGYHNVKYYANDTVGNIGTTENNFTVDTTAPAVALISPVNAYNTSTASISFSFNVTDNLNASMACSLYVNGTSVVTNASTINATATTFANAGVSASLNQNWTVSCSDGVNSNTPANRTFNVDNAVPTSNAPADASYSQGASATIGWTLYDNYATRYYTVYRNGTIQNQSLWQNNTNLNVWANTSALGIWNYTITYNDSLGNNGIFDTVIINIIEASVYVTTDNQSRSAWNETFSGDQNNTFWLNLLKIKGVGSATLNVSGYNSDSETIYHREGGTHYTLTSGQCMIFGIKDGDFNLLINRVTFSLDYGATGHFYLYFNNGTLISDCGNYSSTAYNINCDITPMKMLNTSYRLKYNESVSGYVNSIINDDGWKWNGTAGYDPDCNGLANGFYSAGQIGYVLNGTLALTNPYIDTANSGSPWEWNYTGEFNSSVGSQQVNLNTTLINNYLSTCTAIGGYCQVPITAHSDAAGILQISNINISQKNYNPLTITSSNGWLLLDGQATTLSCTDSSPESTPTLKVNGVTVSNPYSILGSIGTYVVECTADETAEYLSSSASNTLTVNSLESCTDSNAFAYNAVISTTSNQTTLNLTNLVNQYRVRKNLGDVVVANVTQTWINTTEGYYIVVNNTGLSSLNVSFGNHFVNNTYTTNARLGNLTNITAYSQINYYIEYNILNEFTRAYFYPPNATLTSIISCSKGETYIPIDSNITQFIVASRSIISKASLRVLYTSSAYYSRQFYPSAADALKFNFYVADAFINLLDRIDFLVQDMNLYNSKLQIYKTVNGETQIITEGYFDTSHYFSAYLLEDVDYYLRTINADGTITELGRMTVEAPATKTIGQVTMSLSPQATLIADKVLMNSWMNDDRTMLYVKFNDATNQTTELNITIKYQNGTVFQSLTYANTSSVDLSYNVTPLSNQSFTAYFSFNHPIFGNSEITYSVTSIPDIFWDLGIGTFWYRMFSLGILVSVGGITSRKNLVAGSAIFLILLLVFIKIGWLLLPLAGVVFIGLLLLLGIAVYHKQSGE